MIFLRYHGGWGQDKLAYTACLPPLQLSMQTNATKKTAAFDLNYVYDKIHHQIQIV